MDRETELSIVERLRHGDPEAFDTVYEACRGRLYAFLLRLSRHRTVAEDLLEETWLRLVSKAGSLRPDTKVGAWLFTVARNLYWSYRRSRVVEQSVEPELLSLWPSPEPWPSPFELAAMDELRGRVERALAHLPAQHREVLLLVVGECLTPGEAADVCGVTPVVLRQRLSRARAALARELNLSRADATQPRRFGT